MMTLNFYFIFMLQFFPYFVNPYLIWHSRHSTDAPWSFVWSCVRLCSVFPLQLPRATCADDRFCLLAQNNASLILTFWARFQHNRLSFLFAHTVSEYFVLTIVNSLIATRFHLCFQSAFVATSSFYVRFKRWRPYIAQLPQLFQLHVFGLEWFRQVFEDGSTRLQLKRAELQRVSTARLLYQLVV